MLNKQARRVSCRKRYSDSAVAFPACMPHLSG
jgi:hypothetical protein